ncbi:ATP-binding protein [Pelagicoccus sp. SDUM812003]|uniref:ATP-binding protein n=1 Tax=Pelagicoccus sp. SDUM812003 TaxID=3041267 RepID=UPI00280EA908|nr:ATP-binding protein [Pelagicoccus sp. SDUM812003]MDQ8203711.1 ATP-binding protein [Pelagicoccus sp. SDUM812003]
MPPSLLRFLGLAAIVAGLLLRSLYGEQPYSPARTDPNLESWRWTEFPFLDGRGVSYMTESPANTFWFGGAGSIYRYDGYEVREFGPATGFLGTATLSLETSPSGDLYAGSDQGLFRFEGERWIPVLASHTPGRVQIREISFLPDGAVLVGIGEREENEDTPRNWHGLGLIRGDQMKLYSAATPARDDFYGTVQNLTAVSPPEEIGIMMSDTKELNVTSSLVASDGSVYAVISKNNGDNNHIARFAYAPDSFELTLQDAFFRADGISIDSLSNLIESEDGEIWATSNSAVSGISRWNGSTWSHLRITDHFPGSELFYHSLRSSDGAIWVDGFGQYFVFRSGSWTKYAAPEVPLTSNNRINFFEAADGAMWLIASNSKVFRLDYASRSWKTLKGLAFQLETPAGESYYLTEEGRVARESDDVWTSYGTEDGLIDAPVRLFLTSYGELWAIGSHRKDAALSYRDSKGNWNILSFPSLSWGLDHRAAFEDRSGRLYFAAAVDTSPEQEPGIIRFNRPVGSKEDWTLLRSDPRNITKGSFYGLGQDPQGRIWVGGRPPVIVESDALKRTKQFPHLSTYVDYVFNQPDGDLWLLTRDQGILQITDHGEVWHTIDTDLPSHSLISGFARSGEDVWVALSDQIAHFDGISWSSFMQLPEANYTRAGVFIKDGPSDGIHIVQVSNQWTRRALYDSQPAEIAIPFQTLTAFKDKSAPRIEITHFEPQVSERGNTSITWQAVDYLEATPRDKIEYSYKLNDRQWTPFARQNHQMFLGLPHGSHTLQVKARDHGFNVSPEIAAVTFSVTAPIWRQTWFQATIAVLVGLVIFLWILTQSRNNRLQLLNANLSKANEKLQLQRATIESQNRILRQGKSDLEKRVRERTKDLEQAKRKAEESDHLKSAFLANVSHEIRTPMNAIIGFSDLLMASTQTQGEQRDFIRTIQNSGKDLLNLIDDIIEISKIESEKIEIETQDISVDWILSQTHDTFRGVLTSFGRDNLQFLVAKEELPEGCILNTDPDRLKQVLKNLISNAIKFTPDGYIQLGCRPTAQGDALEFSVEDSGFGIKKEQLSLIFERFQKGDTNLGHTYRGSGLGLAISQNLVSKLGGALRVESEYQKGSRFYFSLPWDGRIRRDFDVPQAEAPEIPPPSIPHRPQEPVLLVEDEETNSTLMAKMLQQLGVPFVHASSGERAVALCKRRTFSAVLMDIKLPEMQGDEAARRIREIAPDLPIISQTAYAMAGERERYSHDPFSGYLSKPLSISSLAQALNATGRVR